MCYGQRKKPIIFGGGQRSSGVTGGQSLKTLCARYLKACDKSICTLLGREPCQCTEADNYCVICCVNEGGGCTPFNVLNGSREVKFMDTGSPCNAFMGYCDVFSECRLAQEDGPLAGIIRSIFPSEETQLFDAVVFMAKK
ncbi:Disintegrin and metalloproteinase domain-containing protein 10 [Holothuria leucospilota]|uniref:Disintegrin and metalloproteinase domain-containing protein 10 n=1 Tax=Holothuria leucospilota TaxID=206669 RepID=A0A9Q1H8H3_HOLLE|nr:Disintegrin and metalloproteinase domain-containing protein 10 [Holothuria leucospilota]